jgi:hypothetical protein
VIEQENSRIATEAIALKNAAAAVLSDDGHKEFVKLIERLREE